MKKNQPKQRKQKERKKKVVDRLILHLADGKQVDFFTLNPELRGKLIIENPRVREAVSEFKEMRRTK